MTNIFRNTNWIYIAIVFINISCLNITKFIGERPEKGYRFKNSTKREVYSAINCVYKNYPSCDPIANYIKSKQNNKQPINYRFNEIIEKHDTLQYYFDIELNDTTILTYHTRFYRNEEAWDSTENNFGLKTELLVDGVWDNQVFYDLRNYPSNGHSTKKIQLKYLKKFEKKILPKIKEFLTHPENCF